MKQMKHTNLVGIAQGKNERSPRRSSPTPSGLPGTNGHISNVETVPEMLPVKQALLQRERPELLGCFELNLFVHRVLELSRATPFLRFFLFQKAAPPTYQAWSVVSCSPAIGGHARNNHQFITYHSNVLGCVTVVCARHVRSVLHHLRKESNHCRKRVYAAYRKTVSNLSLHCPQICLCVSLQPRQRFSQREQL